MLPSHSEKIQRSLCIVGLALAMFCVTSCFAPLRGEAAAAKESAIYVTPSPSPTPYLGHHEGYQYYDVPLSLEDQDYIQDLMVEYDLPLKYFRYVLALIQRESEFCSAAKNANADGSVDFGYMQINSANFPWLKEALGIDDCTDPKNNLRCGIYCLKDLYSSLGDFKYALIGYRRGYYMGLQYKQLDVIDEYTEYIIDYAKTLTPQ